MRLFDDHAFGFQLARRRQNHFSNLRINRRYAEVTRHGHASGLPARLRSGEIAHVFARQREWVACLCSDHGLKQQGKVGDVAGSMKQNGYVNTAMFGVTYPTHRLVWLYVTGKWPSLTIDHRDTNRSNNRFWNLRDVTQQVNAQNQRRAMSTNRSGLLGAHWDESIGKFKPRIRRPDGKYQYLGVFATAELAHLAYVAAKRLIHEGSTL